MLATTWLYHQGWARAKAAVGDDVVYCTAHMGGRQAQSARPLPLHACTHKAIARRSLSVTRQEVASKRWMQLPVYLQVGSNDVDDGDDHLPTYMTSSKASEPAFENCAGTIMALHSLPSNHASLDTTTRCHCVLL